ncbi:MAG TPA: pyrimidine dimer DNA glycosylase/endonuclease V [Candidatus Limnocylindrales bacterium]|nr:pyrimidine dimer DNA glycosylase/endonuclease V [Candidatus Limnocylindrales bacterium]
MRIWDLSPSILCRKHLLGEHLELHSIWTVITQNKKGYSRHPETLRWVGKLKALYNRHDHLVNEMKNRGYNHHSDLDKKLATGSSKQTTFINTPDEQLEIIKGKKCSCKI